jgi:hypothetical protein
VILPAPYFRRFAHNRNLEAFVGGVTASAIGAIAAAAVVFETRIALAFPPYRSTDAETADAWTLEGRLGLLRYTRAESENTYTSPLVRINFGLPRGLELTAELEYPGCGHPPARGNPFKGDPSPISTLVSTLRPMSGAQVCFRR